MALVGTEGHSARRGPRGEPRRCKNSMKYSHPRGDQRRRRAPERRSLNPSATWDARAHRRALVSRCVVEPGEANDRPRQTWVKTMRISPRSASESVSVQPSASALAFSRSMANTHCCSSATLRVRGRPRGRGRRISHHGVVGRPRFRGTGGCRVASAVRLLTASSTRPRSKRRHPAADTPGSAARTGSDVPAGCEFP